MKEEETEIQKRIRKAREALAEYPEWVRVNNVFQGGQKTRGEERDRSNPYGNY